MLSAKLEQAARYYPISQWGRFDLSGQNFRLELKQVEKLMNVASSVSQEHGTVLWIFISLLLIDRQKCMQLVCLSFLADSNPTLLAVMCGMYFLLNWCVISSGQGQRRLEERKNCQSTRAKTTLTMTRVYQTRLGLGQLVEIVEIPAWEGSAETRNALQRQKAR